MQDATVGPRKRLARLLADLQRRLAAVPHPRAPRPTLDPVGRRRLSRWGRAVLLAARRMATLDWDPDLPSSADPHWPTHPSPGPLAGSPRARRPAAHRCSAPERHLHRGVAFLMGPRDGAALLRTLHRLPHLGLALVGHDRFLPTVVAGLVVGAVLVTRSPLGAAEGIEGWRADAPRIAIGGTGQEGGWTDGEAGGPNDGRGTTGPGEAVLGFTSADGGAAAPSPSPLDPRVAQLDGPAGTPSVDDGGVLFKPVVVDPTVPDGRDTLQTYTVRPGDTLTGIARKFGLSMMTLWWANHLSSKDELHVGQILVIPPVDGLVITVKEGDTLDAIAARTGVDKETIFNFNGLKDETLVVGQTLVIPGARGAPIPTPKPTPVPAVPRPVSGGSGGGSTTVRPPGAYGGGPLTWPLPGGYISQYFHASHPAIDIAADYGSPVRAAAAGTVIFAGWRSNCGGYQIWIAHGSNLYTTYNHLSAILVGTGATVARGQLIGRVGATGCATGPHLHFEVWIGPPWDGGDRVNPLRYL